MDYVHQQGWVLIAFQNALYQLLHAPNLEAGVVDTIAAICGALLGALCRPGGYSGPVARQVAELLPRGRKSASTPPTPGMFLAGGCSGAGRELTRMMLAIAALIAGLALLVWIANRFVEGSASTARHFGMPPLLIGMVIVGCFHFDLYRWECGNCPW